MTGPCNDCHKKSYRAKPPARQNPKSEYRSSKQYQGLTKEFISKFTFSKGAHKAGAERGGFRHSRKSGNPGEGQKRTGCPPARA